MFNGTTAPIEHTLDDGTKIAFHPLDFGDCSKLDNIIRGRILDAARSSFNEDTTEQEKRETLSAAFAHAMKMSFISANMGGGFIETFEGIVTMAHLSLKHGNPDVTIEDAAKLISDATTREIFTELLAAQIKTSSDPQRRAARKKVPKK